MESIVLLNGGISGLYEKLMMPQRLYIVYEDELGNETGVDEGGLTRDFYSSFHIQIKECFEEVDGYLMPKSGTLTLVEWKIVGIIMSRSIFSENISLSLNLHPLLCYWFQNGSQISMNNLFSAMKPFEIDYMDNMEKLTKMPSETYEEFMVLQGEDGSVPCNTYAMNCIIDKYVSEPVKRLVSGFREQFDKHWGIKKYMNLDVFYRFVRGVEHYNICKTNSLSMKENLVVSCNDNPSPHIDAALATIKETFIEVIDHLNSTDINKLKAFLKFWYGTSSIQSFENKKATVRLLRNDELHGIPCFESSTCFYTLYVYQPLLMKNSKHKDKLFQDIMNMIDVTLTNQGLVESAGLYMQQS